MTSSTPSLCRQCRWMRVITTPRGASYLLCQRHLDHPSMAKYPPQPVLACSQYEAVNFAPDAPRT